MMSKYSYLLFICVLWSSTCFAQGDKVLTTEEEKKVIAKLKEQAAPDSIVWKKGGNIAMTATQTYLSQWAAGGNNSITTVGALNLFANYRKGKDSWDNTLDVGYGLTLLDLASRAIKNDDRIDFSSKYGRQASNKWFYAGLLNFRTQFAPGYTVSGGLPVYTDALGNDAKISNLLAPAYLLIALGMDYKPSNNLTAFISPVTFKGTIVNDQRLADAGAFGVTPAVYNDLGEVVTSGENFRSEVGGYVKVQYNTGLAENVTFLTKIDVFSNYSENPQNIDINWENQLTLKANEYFNASLITQIIYDHDVMVPKGDGKSGPGMQLRQVLGIGFSYKF
ncbi:MAG: hypothetical protein RL220_2057 [Bacteroidota bacterium]|jgi:hypothetical protein